MPTDPALRDAIAILWGGGICSHLLLFRGFYSADLSPRTGLGLPNLPRTLEREKISSSVFLSVFLSGFDVLAMDLESQEDQRLLHEEESYKRELDNKQHGYMGMRPCALAVKATFGLVSLVLAAYLLWVISSYWRLQLQDPRLARTVNGTYEGTYSHEHEQYSFLGMPYALPPIGAFRFRQPRPLNTSWDNIRKADRYGPDCYGYGVSLPSPLLR